jgi:hypothetical protein
LVTPAPELRTPSYRYMRLVKPRVDSVVGDDGGPPPDRPAMPRSASLKVRAPRCCIASCDRISTEAGVSRTDRPRRDAVPLDSSRCRLLASRLPSMVTVPSSALACAWAAWNDAAAATAAAVRMNMVIGLLFF